MTASTPPPSTPPAAPRPPSQHAPPLRDPSPPSPSSAPALPPRPPLPPATPHALPPFYAPAPYPFSMPFAAAYLHAPPHMYPLHPTWASSPFPFYAWPAPHPPPPPPPSARSTPLDPSSPSSTAPSANLHHQHLHHHHQQSSPPPPQSRRRPPRRRSPTPPPNTTAPSSPPVPTDQDLAIATDKALAADDNCVSLSLMLTSWNNALADTAHPASALAFAHALHSSRALCAVALSPPLLSATHPTLLAQQTTLYDLVLFAADSVADPLSATARSCYATDPALPQRPQLSQLLLLLCDLRLASDALASVLPSQTPPLALDHQPDPALPSVLPPAQCLAKSASHVRHALGLTHLHLHHALLISRYAAQIDRLLSHQPVLAPLRTRLARILSAQVAAKKSHLQWHDLLVPFCDRIFSVVQRESHGLLNRFHALQHRVRSCLQHPSLFDTPPPPTTAKSLLRPTVQQTLNAAAAAAALLSAQQRAFDWAMHAAVLLRSVRTAVRTLISLAVNMRPSDPLLQQFERAVQDAFTNVQNVVEYASDAPAKLVLDAVHTDPAPGKRILRFEEPPKQQRSPNARRKPRHARMKSSPDALLHLNAHFDDYDDQEDDHAQSPKQPSTPAPNNSSSNNNSSNNNNSKPYEQDDSDSSTDTTRIYEGTTTNVHIDDDADDEMVPNHTATTSLPLGHSDLHPHDSEDDDGEIIVHDSHHNAVATADDDDDDDKPKKVLHPSHLRSMSVDGIPF